MRSWLPQSIGSTIRLKRHITAVICSLCCLLSTPALAGQVAIIIDDIGYRYTDNNVLKLPSSVTLSILPHTKIGGQLAQIAHHQGHEIMVHLPMQALNGQKLGPGGLTNNMTEEQIKQSIQASVRSVPNAVGVNNHMGSLLTQLADPMAWVMQELKQQELFFVDSITTRYSKAAEQANQQGIPLLTRQVFLDNRLDTESLEKQFSQMINMSHQQGYVVMIAHPHPQTISFLQANLHRLNQEGISLVPVSMLLPYKLALKQAQTKPSS
ncbi:divergent polysaccharide deacetylase family protein [Shewanella sp. NIFS-20-20]|uniref:divergent polysaccharide deacetylase family protein n=1 Tax=Shewanella sp. NIFS-20-20 TaxID=2853806 RepID=UPI001C4900B7|nr:divergent polysaccharide deacetylase family protein [Shewanella sp. NIFS-20-20]MBV7317495.1 divergent polysaccharide deacetylase family protein [Shewanella sp. NIFS-20-20]